MSTDATVRGLVGVSLHGELGAHMALEVEEFAREARVALCYLGVEVYELAACGLVRKVPFSPSMASLLPAVSLSTEG